MKSIFGFMNLLSFKLHEKIVPMNSRQVDRLTIYYLGRKRDRQIDKQIVRQKFR